MNPNFVPTKNGSGYGYQPINEVISPQGGGTHDTFKVDPDGGISGGHTTTQIPGGQSVGLPWNPGSICTGH